MKKQRKTRNLNMELYKKLEEMSGGYRDTRYWGVFNGKEKDLIKPTTNNVILEEN